VNQEKNVKKAFLWNMIGSTCYSASSFLYLLIVTRLCGVELAGFFSLSYATAQLLLQVGRYGMRTFQATDLDHKYLFSEYKVSRVFSCAAMMLFGVIYSAYSFSGEYIAISIFVIMMKMIDAVEDVFHGNLQQNYHVELMGKMLAVRNVYSAVFFTLLLYFTRNLYLTCGATAITSLMLCLLVNSWAVQHISSRQPKRSFQFSHVLELLKMCTPLFAGTFLSLLLYNVPKYAMSNVMTDEYHKFHVEIPEAADNIIRQDCSLEDAHPFAKIEEIQHTALLLFAGYLNAATSIAASSGGGGSDTGGWGRDKDEDELEWARRCARMANSMCKRKKGLHR